MNVNIHGELTGKIWEIANRLRGPYRPPQYRLVMLPMVVLRRLGGSPTGIGCKARAFLWIQLAIVNPMPHILEKLRRRLYPGHQQPIPRPRTSHIEQMPLGLVDHV